MHDRCYGIIPIKDGKAYIVHHAEGKYWGFPKGHQEVGETPQETAIRELEEETNLEVISLDESTPFLEAYSFERNGDEIHKTVVYFVAEVDGTASPNADDVTEGRWVPLDNLVDELTFDGNKKIAETVRNRYA